MKRPGLTRSIWDLAYTLVLPPAPTKGEGADDSPCPHRSREEDPQGRQAGPPQAPNGDARARPNAIDRCRQADAAFVAASHRFDETGTVEADTAARKAGAAFAAARLTLARTVPTTPAGLAAIMGFVWSQTVEYGRIYFDD